MKVSEMVTPINCMDCVMHWVVEVNACAQTFRVVFNSFIWHGAPCGGIYKQNHVDIFRTVRTEVCVPRFLILNTSYCSRKRPPSFT